MNIEQDNGERKRHIIERWINFHTILYIENQCADKGMVIILKLDTSS